MFVLDEPYISDFLYETIKKNNYSVLSNGMTKDKGLNLILDNEFVEFFGKNKKIYTNSENSIQKLLIYLEDKKIAEWIKLFKDKTKFRKVLKNIYPNFFFEEVEYKDLKNLDKAKLKYPFVIKPAVGFLSMGVYTVFNPNELDETRTKIDNFAQKNSGFFPKDVLNSNKFIIEEYIKGEEYAVDAYFDDNSNPVILNIFKHPFSDKYDVSDRMYITSGQIIKDNLKDFENILCKIGSLIGLNNFPLHIELKKDGNKIIPVEINPLRFAGWCTCDIAYYAYGINIYEYFMRNEKPVWDEILKDNNSVYAFVMGEVPCDINKNEIENFDINKFKKDTNAKILEERTFDYLEKPVFCVLFIQAGDFEQIKDILKLNIKNYINMKTKTLLR